jgi:hypothetical protein
MEQELAVKSVESNSVNTSYYSSELRKLQSEKRKNDNINNIEHNNRIRELQESCGIEPKPRSTNKDIGILIGMVLTTGNTGTKVLKVYAAENSKDDDWKISIAREKVSSRFKQVLLSYQEHSVIIRMKGNKMYNEKDILNSSLTGALRKLSKLLALSNAKDADKNDKVILIELLAVKKDTSSKTKTDWSEVQAYRDKGLTVRVLANTFGVSPAAVSKYTKKLISVI